MVALLVATASCSAPETVDQPPAEVVDRAGAPPIVAPRELRSRADDPCATLLSEEQVQQLGYGPVGRARTTAAGSPACSWRTDGSGKRVDVSVVVKRDLFVDSYRNRVLPIFRPIEIEGLPAVDLQSFDSAPTCTTTVGVADGESLDVNVAAAVGRGGGPASDPCEEGHRVAEAIVSTLPPK